MNEDQIPAGITLKRVIVVDEDADSDPVTEALRPVVKALPRAQSKLVRDYVYDYRDATRCLRDVSRFVLKTLAIEPRDQPFHPSKQDPEASFQAWLEGLTLPEGRTVPVQVLDVEFDIAQTCMKIVLPVDMDIAAAFVAADLGVEINGIRAGKISNPNP